MHLPQVSVTFLGTSAAWPSSQRNVASTAIKWGGEVVLFDVGEGTQRQLQRSGLSFMAVRRVFLTHLHGDHHYGLPGLLKTMQLNERTEPLELYGPRGTADLMSVYRRIANVHGQYEVRVHEVGDGEQVRFEDVPYWVEARKLAHGLYNLGYAFCEPDRPGKFDKPAALGLGVPEGPLFKRLIAGQEVTLENGTVVTPQQVVGPPRKGRKIVISGDTGPCKNLEILAKDADVLIAESTYCDDMQDKAAEYGHLTASQAAQAARAAGVGRLVLTHISPRYTEDKQHLKEAAAIFEGTAVARDLLTLEVPLAK